jgi:hypothetical protein
MLTELHNDLIRHVISFLKKSDLHILYTVSHKLKEIVGNPYYNHIKSFNDLITLKSVPHLLKDQIYYLSLKKTIKINPILKTVSILHSKNGMHYYTFKFDVVHNTDSFSDFVKQINDLKKNKNIDCYRFLEKLTSRSIDISIKTHLAIGSYNGMEHASPQPINVYKITKHGYPDNSVGIGQCIRPKITIKGLIFYISRGVLTCRLSVDLDKNFLFKENSTIK